jgi:hypothetical protein
MFDEYSAARLAASPSVQASMPVPDYQLFTNNSAFASTLFSYIYYDQPVVKEFGPYIIRDTRLITDDASLIVPTYEVSYYNAENDEGAWCTVRVEERAVLKVSPLLRDQDILEDIRFNRMYRGHVQKCSMCGTWWTNNHEARQCMQDEEEEEEEFNEFDDDRATVVLVDSEGEGDEGEDEGEDEGDEGDEDETWLAAANHVYDALDDELL